MPFSLSNSIRLLAYSPIRLSKLWGPSPCLKNNYLHFVRFTFATQSHKLFLIKANNVRLMGEGPYCVYFDLYHSARLVDRQLLYHA